MNYINKATTDSAITSFVDYRYVIYFYLISDVNEYDDDIIYSTCVLDKLYIKFKNIKQEKIDFYLEKLVEEKLLALDEDEDDGETYFSVGVCSEEGFSKLYSANSNSLEDYNKQVYDAILSYCKDASGIDKLKANKLKATFEALSSRSVEEYTHGEFVKLHMCVYEAFFQETPREFMAKEHGQLKQLRKQYEPSILYKLIVFYYSNSHLFDKQVSLNVLVYKKDAIYLKMKGKDRAVKSKSHMSTFKPEEDF